MSGVIGPISSPQTIPDAAQPGSAGSRATFFLRSTPRVFTVISAGQSNQDFQIGASVPTDVLQILRDSRLVRAPFSAPGAPPATVTYDLAMGYAAAGKVTARSSATFPLAMSYSTGASGVSATFGGLYESLISADRPLAWWGFDSDPTEDESGRGYTLTAVGSPVPGSTLLAHGNELNGASREFNGSSDAYYTLGTLYDPPDGPPAYHSASAGAGSTQFTSVVSPAGVEAGDLGIACIVHSSNTATISAAPSGWTQVGTTLNAGSCAVAVYKRLPVADEPPTEYTWTWSASGTTLGTILVYRNCNQDVSGLVYDSGQQATSSGVSHSTTTETNPVQAHALALWCGDFSGTITAYPTGLKRRVDISTGNVKILAAEYDVEEAGSVVRTATTSATTQLGAILLTFGAPDEVRENELDALAENVSLHALIRPDTVAAGTRTIIRKQGSWGLQLNGATVEFVYTDGGGVDRTVTGPTVSASTVTHLVVADDGSNIHFYKNGVETTASRTGAAGYTTNANRVVVGAYYNGSAYSNYFDGRLDEVAVLGACVSDSMVDAWYEAHSAGTFGTQFLGGNPSYPSLKIEMAFASSPTDPTLVWEDVTADLRGVEGVSATRGRNFELDRIETGRMDFTLSNRNRQYDDTYASSPYYPNVKPTRPVRLRAQVSTDGVAYPIFFGYTEGHPLLRIAYGTDSVARFTATDAFKALSLDKVQGSFVRPRELSGARLEALLDGFPGIPFSGEAGQSEVIGDDLNGVNSLDHAQTIAESEGGIMYANSSGTIVFEDRHHRVRYSRDVQATYGDGGGGELPIRHMEPLLDEARLFTSASVTPASGETKQEIDVAASADHFVRTKELTTLQAIDNDAQAMAEAYAHRYAVPRTRIPSVQLQPAGHSLPATMWDAVLSHEISHRIRTVERPIGDTSAITRDHFIEGISHAITAQDWVVTFSVSPAELEGEYWLVGSGELGDTAGATSTRLGW
jgi:hypothetical protein